MEARHLAAQAAAVLRGALGASGRASRSSERSQSSFTHSHISLEMRSRTTRAFSRARRRLLRTEPGLRALARQELDHPRAA